MRTKIECGLTSLKPSPMSTDTSEISTGSVLNWTENASDSLLLFLNTKTTHCSKRFKCFLFWSKMHKTLLIESFQCSKMTSPETPKICFVSAQLFFTEWIFSWFSVLSNFFSPQQEPPKKSSSEISSVSVPKQFSISFFGKTLLFFFPSFSVLSIIFNFFGLVRDFFPVFSAKRNQQKSERRRKKIGHSLKSSFRGARRLVTTCCLRMLMARVRFFAELQWMIETSGFSGHGFESRWFFYYSCQPKGYISEVKAQ